MTAAHSLWPTDIDLDPPTPRELLAEQARALDEQTNGRLKGALHDQHVPGLEPSVALIIEAPVLDYRHQLLALRQVDRSRAYPVLVEAECLVPPGMDQRRDSVGEPGGLNHWEVYPTAADARELQTYLGTVLGHRGTRALLTSLLAEIRLRSLQAQPETLSKG